MAKGAGLKLVNTAKTRGDALQPVATKKYAIKTNVKGGGKK